MKKVIIVFAATALSLSPLIAHPFEGAYLGTSLGYGTSKGETTNKVKTGIVENMNATPVGAGSGSIVGANVGWDLVLQNRWLVGIETGVDKLDISGKTDSNSATGSMHTKYKTDIATYTSILRGGVIFDNTGIYGGIGLIATTWIYNASFSAANGKNQKLDEVKKLKYALYYVAGSQTAISEKVILAVEAGYARFGKVRSNQVFNDNPGFGANTLASFRYKPVITTLKVKMIVKA